MVLSYFGAQIRTPRKILGPEPCSRAPGTPGGRVLGRTEMCCLIFSINRRVQGLGPFDKGSGPWDQFPHHFHTLPQRRVWGPSHCHHCHHRAAGAPGSQGVPQGPLVSHWEAFWTPRGPGSPGGGTATVRTAWRCGGAGPP